MREPSPGPPQNSLHLPDEANACERRLRYALEPRTEVRWAYLFGSGARGEPFHDADVGVMLDPQARGAVALGRVVNCLQEAAGSIPVDVVDLASAAPALLGRVVREGRLLVDREPERRREWEAEANGRALDLAPWLAEFERLRDEARKRRLGSW